MNDPSRLRKNWLMVGAIALGLVVTLWWMFDHLTASRDAARLATSDTADCQRLAEQIRLLQQQPSQAHTQDVRSDQLAAVIEETALQAGIARQSLASITPEPARRLADSPYQREPTQVVFRNVTIPDLVRCLQRLSALDAGPTVTHLRLTAPSGEEAGDRWSAEVTLTYLVFAPTVTRPDAAAPRS